MAEPRRPSGDAVDVLRAIPDAAVVTVDRRAVDCNPAAMAFFGLDDVDQLGRLPFDAFVHPEERGAAIERNARIVGGETVPSFVERSADRDGGWRHLEVSGAPIRWHGRAGALYVMRDVTARVQAVEHATDMLAYGAEHDVMTGLRNRAGFLADLGRVVERGPAGVVLLDIRHFALVNESQGSRVGDGVLREVADRIRGCVRPDDVVARTGGDAFAVVAPGVGDCEDALQLATRCHEAIARPLVLKDAVLHLRASFGVAVGATGSDPTDVLSSAGAALDTARRRGGGTEVGAPGATSRATQRLALEADLRSALAEDRVEGHLQPVWRTDDGRCVGFEALARWTRDGQPVRPDRFVPLAEQLQLSRDLDCQVAGHAARLLAERIDDGAMSSSTYLAVNIDPQLLCSAGNAERLVGHVVEAGLAADALVVELTERRLPGDLDALRRGVEQLRSLGARLALDDFGVGQSSLARLVTLPFDMVKLDRLFVEHLDHPRGRDVVAGVLDMARRVHLQVVVEGVETEAQRRLLVELGAEAAQGWLVAPALDRCGLAAYDPAPGRFTAV